MDKTASQITGTAEKVLEGGAATAEEAEAEGGNAFLLCALANKRKKNSGTS